MVELLTDINECLNATHDCSPYANCTNTIGSFSCECQNGFDGNGTVCEGIVILFSDMKSLILFSS